MQMTIFPAQTPAGEVLRTLLATRTMQSVRCTVKRAITSVTCVKVKICAYRDSNSVLHFRVRRCAGLSIPGQDNSFMLRIINIYSFLSIPLQYLFFILICFDNRIIRIIIFSGFIPL